jgi:hypothetical protein
MRAPTTAILLDAWEHGLGQPPPRRAIALLAAAYPEVSYETLGRLSVGESDSRLLSLRELLFGSRLHGVSSCPHCREKIEMDFAVADLRAAIPGNPPPETLTVSVHSYDVVFRLPTALDLEAAATAPDAGSARTVLFARCVLTATTPAGAVAPENVPATIVAAVSEVMGRADPQAATEIKLVCPACTYHWRVAFDAGAFLWAEIHAWGQQQLRDIHTLAAAYGWSEAEILALTPARRRAYLDLVQS